MTGVAPSSRPECANGCPLTDPSACRIGGCIRDIRVPVYVTVADPEPRILPPPGKLAPPTPTRDTGHAGQEPPRRRPDADGTVRVTPDMPMRWAPIIVLALVILTAVLCALAGWTR